MRLIERLTLLVVVALSACASPGGRESPSDIAGSAPPPAPIAEPPAASPDPPSTVVALAPIPALPPPPFSEVVAAELEPLPTPSQDLWARIVAGYSLPDLDGPLVAKWEEWYSERPDYVARMVDRSRRYLYHVVSEVQQRGMPLDIALLPMVESAFNPVALSTSRAAGIWQFIPSTGKHWGLAQNFWFDSRRDVIAATDKALDYLQKLYGDFGDWQLALAAYNWGEGNVSRALARNQSRGLPGDYASLPMPDETRNYLPKLQAVKNIVRDPEKYGLVLADIPDAPYFTVVKTTRRMDVTRAAELAEMPIGEFKALNPQHNRPVIAGADEYTILLPIDRAEVFAAKLDLQDQPLVSWQAYRVRGGESLPQVAFKFGIETETLRAVNGLGPRSRIHAGHTLLVPAERPSQAAAESLERAVFTAVPQGRTFYYRVNRGDTLPAIAARYDVTIDELRQWNGLRHQQLRVGQQLRVTSDVVSVKASASAKRVAIGGARSTKGSTGRERAGTSKAASRQAPDKGSAPAARPAAAVPATGSKRPSEAASRSRRQAGDARATVVHTAR